MMTSARRPPRAANSSETSTLTRAEGPSAATFSRASIAARGGAASALPSAPGRSDPIAQALQPAPGPRSTTSARRASRAARRPAATRHPPARSRRPRAAAPRRRRRAPSARSAASRSARPDPSGGSRLDLLQPLGLLGRRQPVDDLVEIALQDRGQAIQRQPDPVVGHAALAEVVGANPLAPLAGADLRLAVGGHGRLLLLLRALQQAGLQHAHRLRTVLDLRALVLARHDDPGRDVRDAHRGVGGVDALTAGARRAIDVHAQILLLHPHVHVLGLRQHGHRHGGGVDAAARLGDRHTLHPVDAALELEPAPRAAALHEQDDVLETADAGGAPVHHLDLPALRLRVLGVHARELGGEQRRLVAAGAGADLDEDVPVVVGILGEDELLQLVFERGLARGQLVDLALRQLGQLAIAALGQDVPGLAEPLEDVLVLGELLDDLLNVGVLFTQARVLGLLAEDRGVGESALDLMRALFDLAELIEQHGSAPHGGDGTGGFGGPWRGPPRDYWAAAGGRLYLRWKRSTR